MAVVTAAVTEQAIREQSQAACSNFRKAQEALGATRASAQAAYDKMAKLTGKRPRYQAAAGGLDVAAAQDAIRSASKQLMLVDLELSGKTGPQDAEPLAGEIDEVARQLATFAQELRQLRGGR